jgi:hypothetical protein
MKCPGTFRAAQAWALSRHANAVVLSEAKDFNEDDPSSFAGLFQAVKSCVRAERES